jgi:capsid assembly protease
MKRALLASRFFDCPLLIDRGTAEAMVSAFAEDFDVEPLIDARNFDSLARPERQTAIYEEQGGVAVVPIVGELAHRATAINSMSGSVGYAGLQTHLLNLAQDGRVSGILLDMDTPGGEVGGLAELSDSLGEIGKAMPLWAIANSSMNSAGYWIGSVADRVLATPYARVGSIGVVAMHVDVSKAMAKKGVVTTFIHAGKHKIDGNSFEPLSRDAKRQIATSVADIYDQFVGHVSAARRLDENSVRDTEARVYGAKEALEIGLIDDISTLSKAIAGMQVAIQDRRKTFIQGHIMKTYEDGLNEGKATGFQEGVASGTAAANKAAETATQTAVLAAGKAERDRISAIMGSEEAKGRETLASHLAFSTDTAPAAAEAILKASPKAVVTKAPKPVPQTDANQTAESILAAMRQNQPHVSGGDGDEGLASEELRVAEIRANLGNRYRRPRPDPRQIEYQR